MLIRGTVFHSSNCPGSLRETDLFTHCRKCAVINYHYYEPKQVPDSDRSKGGREALGGVGIQKTSEWVCEGTNIHCTSTLAATAPRINNQDPSSSPGRHFLHFKGILLPPCSLAEGFLTLPKQQHPGSSQLWHSLWPSLELPALRDKGNVTPAQDHLHQCPVCSICLLLPGQAGARARH